YGDSGVLVCEDTARPVAGPGQVMVKVAGAAFNPLDVAIRAGYVQEVFPVVLPHIPNYDVAGVITEAGQGVNGWREGDAVVAGLTADGGAFVSTTFPELDDAGRGVRVVSVVARSDAGQLAGLAGRINAGDLRIDVAQRLPLTELAAVHDQAVAGRLPGKTVLIP